MNHFLVASVILYFSVFSEVNLDNPDLTTYAAIDTITIQFSITIDTLEDEQQIVLQINSLPDNVNALEIKIGTTPNGGQLFDETITLEDLDAADLESVDRVGSRLDLNFGTHPIQHYYAQVRVIALDGTITNILTTDTL